MNKKMSKRQKDIKSKLMAAICMLLVSSIMMVSTTYAWFTLSTAPEVTGISTAVGANGNLEMALLPVNGNNIAQNLDYGVTTGTEDSIAATKDASVSNVTWGNLVDLTDYYGLEKITLYPSQVNATMSEDNALIPANITTGQSILKTPKYGVDGRIAALDPNTIPGIYDTENEKAYQEVVVDNSSIDNPAGVRLIGTVSGMSDRQLDFRNALSEASAAATQAQNKARGSLEDNGTALGNIAVKYATNSTAGYNDTDKAALVAMVGALGGTKDENGATTAKGALDYVEQGLRYYIYAYQISISSTEDGYLSYKTQILGDETTAASSLSDLQTANLVPAGMATMITKLGTSRVDVETARTELAKLTDNDYTQGEIMNAMESLVNIQGMKINGTNVYDSKTNAITAGLKTQISDDFIAGKGITVSMPTGAGVFADVADFTGNYGANISVPASAVLEGSTAMIPVTMVTDGISPTYFTQAKNIASETTIESDSDATPAITDYYGYVIDLAFKTNAANSSLKLQTEAVDRYSTESTSEDTMGGGATMIFTTNDPENGFQETEMVELMEHIRVIFFDPSDNNKVLCFGVLDEDTIKPLGGNQVSVGLKVATTPTPEADEDKAEGEASDYIENNIIMPLEQNKAHRLSVLVYLDGTTITNGDVAVGAETSMTGSLNLQFSSTAELEPMKYTDFQTGEETPTPTPTPTTTTVAVDTKEVGETGTTVSDVIVSGTTAGFTVTGYDSAEHTVTVTVDSEPVSVTEGTKEDVPYFYWTIAEGTLTAANNIVITVASK